MPIKNIHREPFDSGTLTKLEIFEKYAQEWLPTWIWGGAKTICIVDFFAGTGYDVNGIPGSAIRLLNQINNYADSINNNKVAVHLHLNEKDKDKFPILKSSFQDWVIKHPETSNFLKITSYQKDFENLFPELLTEIQSHPSLVYFDQNGVRYIGNRYLKKLEELNATDFLFFTSSSYLFRFGDTPEFQKYLQLDRKQMKDAGLKRVHRNLCEQLRKKLSFGTKLRLYPFSIQKKTGNIYGIIFGSSHPRGVDKFLRLAWNQNPFNGEADFDLDDEVENTQLSIFEDRKLTKIEKFQESVQKSIMSGKITNNIQLFEFTLEEGHIGKHAADILKIMRKEGKVRFEGSPLLTYEKAIKEKEIVKYEVI